VQDGTRGIGEANAEDFDSTDLLASLEEKQRAELKVDDYEYAIEENHTFKTDISSQTVMVKFMALFSADTKFRAE